MPERPEVAPGWPLWINSADLLGTASVTEVELTGDDLLSLMYRERQLIVVASDEAVEAARRAQREEEEKTGASKVAASGARWIVPSSGGGAAGVLGAALGAAAVAAGVELWKLRKRAQEKDLPYLVVADSQAEHLRFPHGHPLREVVYVGDPGVPTDYYPMGTFHRLLFEGMFAEAIRLLRNLGATEISFEYVRGYEQAGAVDLTASSKSRRDARGGGSGKQTKKSSSGGKSTWHLSPTKPASVPADLVWFHSEPLWREIASARLESGLRSFHLEVNYTDNFGIDAKVEAKVAELGLQLGGSVTRFQETKWKLSGKFAENLSLEADPA